MTPTWTGATSGLIHACSPNMPELTEAGTYIRSRRFAGSAVPARPLRVQRARAQGSSACRYRQREHRSLQGPRGDEPIQPAGETTMNPAYRTLLQVGVDSAAVADELTRLWATRSSRASCL